MYCYILPWSYFNVLCSRVLCMIYEHWINLVNLVKPWASRLTAEQWGISERISGLKGPQARPTGVWSCALLVVQLSPCRWYTSKSPYMSWNCRGHVVCGWQGAAQVDIHRVPVLSYTLFAVGRWSSSEDWRQWPGPPHSMCFCGSPMTEWRSASCDIPLLEDEDNDARLVSDNGEEGVSWHFIGPQLGERGCVPRWNFSFVKNPHEQSNQCKSYTSSPGSGQELSHQLGGLP